MSQRKKTNGRLRAEYHSELRRLDEAGGGDHLMDLIMDAARRHNEELLGYLAGKIGINYTEDGKTALFWLAGDDDPRAVELLIKAGGKVNAATRGAASPLMHAAFRNRLKNVRLLVQHGAEIGYRDANNDSALSLAETEGHVEMANYLRSILSVKI
jgi:hypothetical protein